MAPLKISVLTLSLLAGLVLSPLSADAADPTLGSRFLPDDALVVIDIKPAELMTHPATELYPREIAQAWVEDAFGVQLDECLRIRIVAGTPAFGPPLMGAVIAMKEPVDIDDISKHVIGDAIPVQVGEYECLDMGNGAVMYQFNPRAIILASDGYLPPVIRAAGGNEESPLGRLAAETPDVGQFSILVGIEPVRPMLSGSLQMAQQMIPPPLQDLTEMPELLESIQVQVVVEDENQFKLHLTAPDADSTERLKDLLAKSFEAGQQIGLAGLAAQLDLDPEINQATMTWATRVSNEIRALLEPQQKDQRLTYEASLAGTGPIQLMMFGGLMPAISSARVAAVRVSTQNNMKQLGLAMHNYHSAYKKLPKSWSTDDEGKPLLSWRVHVLPFLGESALYEQFKLDEPWDSPHNKELLAEIPDAYVPTRPMEIGMTPYRIPVGETVLFQGGKETKFRDVLDGLSNTIMVVETEEGVPWTKPADYEVDLESPLDGLFFDRGVTQIGLADGAVISIADVVEQSVIKAMFTRAEADIAR